MITRITLENFKCFRKLEVTPHLITVFIGPNGSGKSSVLQALALLKQSVGGDRLRLQGPLVNLRSYEQLRPNFDAGAERPSLGLDGSYELPQRFAEVGKTVRFSYTAEFEIGRLVSNSGSISFTDRGRDFTIRLDKQGKVDPPELPAGEPESKVSLGHASRIAQLVEVTRGRSDQVYQSLQESLAAPTRVLERLRFVPAVRGLVRPTYALGEQKTDDISIQNGLGGRSSRPPRTLGTLDH